ncbi:MAG: histidine phosphatase family protein [bacterium]
MFNRKCKITFISHGATIHSEENRLSDNGSYPPINEAGEEEIEKICEWLKKRAIKNDKIYTSPALRTIQTAQMVAKVFKKDFEIINGLHSRKYGVWSGLTFEQIEHKYPQMLNQLHENPSSSCPENGETLLDFNKRVSKILKKIVEENVGNRIIIITHPEVIQAAISKAIKLAPQHQSKIYIKTGSASQISYFESWASLVYSGYVPL